MNEESRKQFLIVKGIVLNDKGEILFVRRKREWHAEAHGKWEFPGGKINFNEKPEDAVIREIKEESGYDAAVTGMIPTMLSAKWDYPDKESQQLLVCYTCELTGGGPVLADSGVSEIRWFNLSAAMKLDSLPGTKEFLGMLNGTA